MESNEYVVVLGRALKNEILMEIKKFWWLLKAWVAEFYFFYGKMHLNSMNLMALKLEFGGGIWWDQLLKSNGAFNVDLVEKTCRNSNKVCAWTVQLKWVNKVVV